jgi:hypothetical protein
MDMPSLCWTLTFVLLPAAGNNNDNGNNNLDANNSHNHHTIGSKDDSGNSGEGSVAAAMW